MSHRDAPPETPSQIACREWWTNAQPHIKRAWGRAKDGSFLAEESKLLHAAWDHDSKPSSSDAPERFDIQMRQWREGTRSAPPMPELAAERAAELERRAIAAINAIDAHNSAREDGE